MKGPPLHPVRPLGAFRLPREQRLALRDAARRAVESMGWSWGGRRATPAPRRKPSSR